MNRIKGDAWVAMVLLVACAFFFNDLLSTDDSGAYVKSTTLPIALTIILAVLSLMLLGWSLLRPVTPSALNAEAAGADRAAALRVVLLFAFMALYITALPWLGFMISTSVLLLGAALLYGNRRPLSILGAMVFIPTGLLLFFEKYMIVLLPSARLFE